jgi:hypothetical protein
MADVKISALPTATSLSDADYIVVNQGTTPATTKKATILTLLPSVNTSGAATYGTDNQVAQIAVDAKGRITSAINTAINASNISAGTLPTTRGGTGAGTPQAAINNLVGSVTSGTYLRANGTNATMAAIQAPDITGTLIVAGTGLSGGNVVSGGTISANFGIAAGTIAQGNDSRITGATPSTRTITAGTGLTGGGDLSANRTIAADFGPVAGKVTEGGTTVLKAGDTMTGKLEIQATDTAAALRVTQLGTGEALRVEDEANPDATAFVVSNTGKVGIGVTPDATAALRVDSNGIKFNISSTPQTQPYIVEKVSTPLGQTSLASGLSIIKNISLSTITGDATPVFAAIAQTNLVPTGLQISAYVRGTTSVAVTIRNANPTGTVSFDSDANIVVSIFS